MRKQILEETRVFHTPDEFSEYIEIKAEENQSSILDTLIKYVEESDYQDYDTIKPMLTQTLKDKLFEEFATRGLVKRNSDLSELFA